MFDSLILKPVRTKQKPFNHAVKSPSESKIKAIEDADNEHSYACTGVVYNHVGSTGIYTTENEDDFEEIREAGHNHVGYINICTAENEDNLEEPMEDGHEDYGTPSIATGLV